MQKIKKLLIISCSTGSGHVRCAEALRLTCLQNYPDWQVLHIDIADYMSWFAKILFVRSYDIFTNNFPTLYGIFYKFTDHPALHKIFIWLRPIFALFAVKFFLKIKEYNPDAIISTHFFSQIIFPENFSIPINVVITDFYAHEVWLSNKAARFFVAVKETKNKLQRFSEKTFISGLPIHPKFMEEKNHGELRTKLGIKNASPVILLMPINKGKIKAKEAVKTILAYNHNLNVVVIAGRNLQTYEDLMKIRRDYKNLTVIGKAENIDEWLKIADVVVTKAGGLTISEALFLKKPLVIINSIPGQEEYNTQYIVDHKFGFKAQSSDDLAKKNQDVLDNPELILYSSQANSAKTILDRVLSIE